MLYDGDCGFCAIWIRRWQQVTGEQVEYLPSKDARVETLFPEVPSDRFDSAVHLVETDGSVYSGAEAAFRALAYHPEHRWLLDWYKHSPALARASEWSYQRVARNRGFFSLLTRVAWGQHVETPTHLLVRDLFLRLLAIIYLIALISLWVQLPGLVGSNGIEPAKLT